MLRARHVLDHVAGALHQLGHPLVRALDGLVGGSGQASAGLLVIILRCTLHNATQANINAETKHCTLAHCTPHCSLHDAHITADCWYLKVVEDNVELVRHGDGPAEKQGEPGLPPVLQHLAVVGRQHRLADHLVEGVVGEQELLEVGELVGDAQLLDVCKYLG